MLQVHWYSLPLPHLTDVCVCHRYCWIYLGTLHMYRLCTLVYNIPTWTRCLTVQPQQPMDYMCTIGKLVTPNDPTIDSCNYRHPHPPCPSWIVRHWIWIASCSALSHLEMVSYVSWSVCVLTADASDIFAIVSYEFSFSAVDDRCVSCSA